ncbi:MAG: nitroreductase family deazaflavin-dependent oxidoreductase [Acidimicrobiales bacterium]
MDFLEFNKNVIEEFRANDGVCGGPFEGAPMVLITMTGAKSGRELCSPLVYSSDGDDVVIIASKAGAPEHPNWYYNLVANPTVTVEVGTDKWEATAKLAEGDERKRLYDAQAAQMPQFSDYETKATEAGREIPVFRLVRN